MLIRDLADGTIDRPLGHPAEIRRALRLRTQIRHRRAARRLERIVERTGRLLPEGLLAEPRFPVELDGRDDEGVPPRLSRVSSARHRCATSG